MFDIAQAIQDAGPGVEPGISGGGAFRSGIDFRFVAGREESGGLSVPNTYEFTPHSKSEGHGVCDGEAIPFGCGADRADDRRPENGHDASIVEKETAVSEERPVVASVYYNRLGRNIALQADPSVHLCGTA